MSSEHQLGRSRHLRRGWWALATRAELLRGPRRRELLGDALALGIVDGEVAAWSDICPHRGARLSDGEISRGLLRCPYHGWAFDAEGELVEAPGVEATVPRCRLRHHAVLEREGVVFVALRAPEMELGGARFDAAEFDSFHIVRSVRAPLVDVLENLLDGLHTPFIHAGVVRTPGSTQRFTGRLVRHDTFLEAVYEGESGQSGILSRVFERERSVSIGRYEPPGTAEIEYRSARGAELVVTVDCAPIDDRSVRAISTIRTRRGRLPALAKRAILEPILRLIGEQDRRILERTQANRRQAGEPPPMLWAGDLLRPAIQGWLERGAFPRDLPAPVTFRL